MKRREREFKKLSVCFMIAIALAAFFTLKVLAYDFLTEDEISPRGIIEEPPSFEVSMITSFNDDLSYEMSLDELQAKIQSYQEVKNSAHNLAEQARSLGWPEDCDAIINAKIEHNNANVAMIFYQSVYDEKLIALEEARWESKKKEYPEATYVWRYMKDLGWNDYVCAGIMGNLMIETGGNTLALNPTAGTTYYGICQWSKGYKGVQGVSLEKQCDYLRDTIKNEFDTYGFIYKKNFNFDSFLKLTDAQQAAAAFAQCYERCGSVSYKLRQKNAIIAYNYYVS